MQYTVRVQTWYLHGPFYYSLSIVLFPQSLEKKKPSDNFTYCYSVLTVRSLQYMTCDHNTGSTFHVVYPVIWQFRRRFDPRHQVRCKNILCSNNWSAGSFGKHNVFDTQPKRHGCQSTSDISWLQSSGHRRVHWFLRSYSVLNVPVESDEVMSNFRWSLKKNIIYTYYIRTSIHSTGLLLSGIILWYYRYYFTILLLLLLFIIAFNRNEDCALSERPYIQVLSLLNARTIQNLLEGRMVVRGAADIRRQTMDFD